MYHPLLAQRAAENRPIRVGIIGTGKFGGGVVAQLSQMRGMEVAVIAELSVERARHAYTVAGRLPDDALRVANNSSELHDVISSGQRAIVEDGMLLVQCDLIDVAAPATACPTAKLSPTICPIHPCSIKRSPSMKSGPAGSPPPEECRSWLICRCERRLTSPACANWPGSILSSFP
ncbi:MAG: hypothetical protein R3A44_32240 [Caldilineaceae bacterium]